MADSVFVIAEAGVNHNGSLDLALQLVDVAADAGADAVKFQTFRAEALVTRRARKAAYQVTNTGSDGDQMEMLRRLELSHEDHEVLVAHCRKRGVGFMSTAFDMESLSYLAGLDMPAVKIPSGDITHGPMLLAAARLGKPLIVSTGMSTLADIEAALDVIAFALTREGEPAGRRDLEGVRSEPEAQAALRGRVTLLHCITEYPAPPSEVNLNAMGTMAAAFGLPVGYSDHTLGVSVSIAAVALGATVIEKHFTLDRHMEGPDHSASLEPDDLRLLVESIRTVESALGSRLKQPSRAESANRLVARRAIVAARPVAAGSLVTAADLTAKRPADGLSPMATWDLIGRPAVRDFDMDEPFE
ncbi:MAG: N-acetylneuraminate synthase [Brevundimonas sp.]|uniref:N-acetylneuraminate synthase n=1 Tax=Brevundimonas sp. TaxID=1871086 RepID=UPI0017CF06CD|nr:N-acetylneuraminate synthase [Brevundimonas sp.]MBA4804672.1 N-acetylneuraminate synthase [Brevundimonas sp.]